MYQHDFNPALLDVLARPPRMLLDIGCASGHLGHAVRQKYPQCRTLGIEPGTATANEAAQRLDRVLRGRFEDFDLEAEGIGRGSIDTVVAADVLDPRLEQFYAKNIDQPEINVRVGRLSLERVTNKELAELCTWQFFVLAHPA